MHQIIVCSLDAKSMHCVSSFRMRVQLYSKRLRILLKTLLLSYCTTHEVSGAISTVAFCPGCLAWQSGQYRDKMQLSISLLLNRFPCDTNLDTKPMFYVAFPVL